LHQPYSYQAICNTECTLRPKWVFDTSFAAMQATTNHSIDLIFKKTGSTWVKATLNTGCTIYMDSVLVQIQSAPTSLSLGNDTFLCPGDSIKLNAGNGFNSYQWQNGSADSVLVVHAPGQYYVAVDNLCGDIAKDTILIQPAIVPGLTLGSDATVCTGDTLQVQASPGFNNYIWQSSSLINGQGLQVYIIPDNNENISVNAVTADGCHAYDTLAVTMIRARPVSLGNDTSFCASGFVTLSVVPGYSQYTWNTGSHASSITVNQPGPYWIHATDLNGCIAKDTMYVQQVYALPAFNLGNDFNLCKNNQQRLDPGSFNQYHWQDGSVNRYYTVTSPGMYWVQVTDDHQCSAADTIILNEILPLPGGFLKETDSICQYDHISVSAIGHYNTYQWSTGSIQPAIEVTAPGTYILTVLDNHGCSGNDTIVIIQKNCYTGVYVPTAFTPDGNHLNDDFRAVVYGNAIHFRLQVYNRWGQLLFETTDPRKGWDGKVAGIPTDSAVFAWQCSYQLEGSPPAFQKGTVTLIR
jgi:gliding motility-associated-like protein